MAPAQRSAPAAPENRPAQAPAEPTDADLTTRYHFVERYAVQPEEGALTQYQVAFRETTTQTRDNPQAAPTQTVIVRQARYAERVAELNPVDDRQVSGVIRHYEVAQDQANP